MGLCLTIFVSPNKGRKSHDNAETLDVSNKCWKSYSYGYNKQ